MLHNHPHAIFRKLIPFISINHNLFPQYGFDIGGALPSWLSLSVNYNPLIVMAGGLPWLNKGSNWRDSDMTLCSRALIF